MITKSYLNSLVQNKTVKDSKMFFESYKLKESVQEYDIFLSYSFNDKQFASILAQLLIKNNFSVYMNEKSANSSFVSRETVEQLAKIMDACKSLLYIHTQSSQISKWCPWELGYISGKKHFRCATIPVVDDEKTYNHQEYLKIYPYVDYISRQDNAPIFCVFDIYNRKKCVTLRNFINGDNPKL